MTMVAPAQSGFSPDSKALHVAENTAGGPTDAEEAAVHAAINRRARTMVAMLVLCFGLLTFIELGRHALKAIAH